MTNTPGSTHGHVQSWHVHAHAWSSHDHEHESWGISLQNCTRRLPSARTCAPAVVQRGVPEERRQRVLRQERAPRVAPADMRALGGLWEAGKLRVHVDSHHPLDRLSDAWERSRSGRAVGKIIDVV